MQASRQVRLLRQILPFCCDAQKRTVSLLVEKMNTGCSGTPVQSVGREMRPDQALVHQARLFSCSAAIQALDQPASIGDFSGHARARPELPLAADYDSDDGPFGRDGDEDDIFGGSQQKRSRAASGPPSYQLKQWARDFRMKVVDVNRTSRGSPTGGVGRFSAVVACGNGKGIIGLGTGKSLQMGDAVKKANRQAMKTLFFVPRFNDSTIREPITSTYGKCKVTLYPRGSGSGCRASNLLSDICQLAGISDVGIKTHGSRNLRNTVKALIQGLEGQVVAEELEMFPSGDKNNLVINEESQRIRHAATVQTAGLLRVPR